MTASGKVRVVDVSPEKPKSKFPVLLAPGWAGDSAVYKPIMQVLVNLGREAFMIDGGRWGDYLESAKFNELQERELREGLRRKIANDITPEALFERFPKEQLRKALTILQVLKAKNISQTNVLAHSEGAINAILAATLRPEKFRNILLFAPAGMVGKDSWVRLIMRGIKGDYPQPSLKPYPADDLGRAMAKAAGEITFEGIKECGKKLAKSAPTREYVFSNPLRALKEIIGAADCQIDDLLGPLHEIGVSIVIIATADDCFYDPKKVQQTLKGRKVATFLCVRGGHGIEENNPKFYTHHFDKLFTWLEEKGGEEERGG